MRSVSVGGAGRTEPAGARRDRAGRFCFGGRRRRCWPARDVRLSWHNGALGRRQGLPRWRRWRPIGRSRWCNTGRFSSQSRRTIRWRSGRIRSRGSVRPMWSWCWIASRPGRQRCHKLASGCKVIQAGPDPLYTRFPVRNFQADLSLAGETADIILALAQGMQPLLAGRAASCAARRTEIAAKSSGYPGGCASGGRAGRRGAGDDQGLGQPLPVAGDRGARRDGAVGTGMSAGSADAAVGAKLVSGAAFRRAWMVVSLRAWHATGAAGPDHHRDYGRWVLHVLESRGVPSDRGGARACRSCCWC